VYRFVYRVQLLLDVFGPDSPPDCACSTVYFWREAQSNLYYRGFIYLQYEVEINIQHTNTHSLYPIPSCVWSTVVF